MTTYTPSVTILILNWNGRQLLPGCLAALAGLDYPDFQVVVADNGSTDESLAYVRREYPQVHCLDLGENLGYGRGNNAALARLDQKSEVLVLLNNDVTVRPDWLRELVGPLARPEIGVAGAKLLFPDERHIQHAGAELDYPLVLGQHLDYKAPDRGQLDEERAVDYVTGASMAIRWSVIDQLGLFDPRFAPYYYEEADFCTRVRAAGYQVIYAPRAVAIHHESFSAVKGSPQTDYAFHLNRLRYVLKHYSDAQLANDFIPAESRRLQSTPHSAAGLESIRRVYLQMMLEVSAGEARSQRDQILLAALGQWWETSLRIDPEHVPGIIHGKPLLDPLFRTIQAGWRAFSTKVLFWPIIRRQRASNALLWRLVLEMSRRSPQPLGDKEFVDQITSIRNRLSRIR
jgi:GT2 family glycosyltransferase